MAEEWRPVVGYEDHYSVSSRARVRREAPGRSTSPGRILKIQDHGPGRHRHAWITEEGRQVAIRVCDLVLRAFQGVPPKGFTCHHLDGDCANAKLENLAWTWDMRRNPSPVPPRWMQRDVDLFQALDCHDMNACEELAGLLAWPGHHCAACPRRAANGRKRDLLQSQPRFRSHCLRSMCVERIPLDRLEAEDLPRAAKEFCSDHCLAWHLRTVEGPAR